MQRLVRVYGRGAPASRLRTWKPSHLSTVRNRLLPFFVENSRLFPQRISAACDSAYFRDSRPNNQFSRRSFGFRHAIGLAAAVSVPLVNRKPEDDVEDEVELTLEQSLLDTSEDERLKQTYGVKQDSSIFYRLFRRIKIAFIRYIYEPIATGSRFVQLVIIFVPVFATIPIIFLGSRDPNADNERTGTLWWYRFLVRQMERAGPTFIKVIKP